jgi:MFS family permease
MGAQTLIGHHLGGHATYSGRLTAITKAGPLIGPVVAGACWNRLGPWGGFSVLALFAFGMLLCALALPRHPRQPAEGDKVRSARIRFAAFLPRGADYVAAFRLLSNPMVAMVTLLGAVYHLVAAIQGTFYMSWLTDIGYSATEIGGLVSLGTAAGGVAALATGWLCRFIPGPWLLLIASWAAILFICVTPLATGLVLLGAFMMLRMVGLGISQPLTVTLMLNAVSANERGLSIGLRGTLNRVASIAAPVLMGLVAEALGVEAAFYISAAALTLGLVWLIVHFRRFPDVLPALRRRPAARETAPLPPGSHPTRPKPTLFITIPNRPLDRTADPRYKGRKYLYSWGDE